MDNPNINITQNVGEVKEGGTIIGYQVVYQGEPVRIPAPEDIQLHLTGLKKIETYHRWADEFYIHEEGKVLLLYASPYDDGGRELKELLVCATNATRDISGISKQIRERRNT